MPNAMGSPKFPCIAEHILTSGDQRRDKGAGDARDLGLLAVCTVFTLDTLDFGCNYACVFGVPEGRKKMLTSLDSINVAGATFVDCDASVVPGVLVVAVPLNARKNIYLGRM